MQGKKGSNGVTWLNFFSFFLVNNMPLVEGIKNCKESTTTFPQFLKKIKRIKKKV